MVATKWLDCIIEWGFLEDTGELDVGLLVVAIEVISSLGESVVSIKVVSAEGSISVLGTWMLSCEGIVKLYTGKDVIPVDSRVDEEVFKIVTVSGGILVNSEDGFWYGADIFIVDLALVSELGRKRVDTGAEGLFVCMDMLVSHNPGVKWESGSVLDLVVSKWLGNDVDIVVTHMEGGVLTFLVSLDDSEGIDTEELSSCLILVIFILVTVKLEEE